MKPLTPSTFDFTAPPVVGMPYSACRHAGVITEAHEAGTASEVRLTAGLIAEGTRKLNVGLENGFAKLR